MVKISKKSKRQSTKHRVKVERKVREHKRKMKKETKGNSKKKTKNKKDPGVPNMLPFKEDVIKEAEAYKQRREQEREKKRDARKKARETIQNRKRNLDISVKNQQASYDSLSTKALKERADGVSVKTENSRKAFYKEFMKVVHAADVVLEVLDARDPLGSRCLEAEEMIQSAPGNKKLILVLNKIDLVPKENVLLWLKYLRKELPAIAFKASTQQQRHHLSQSKVAFSTATDDQLKSSHCLGADILTKLLRNYSIHFETPINVGVVGFPNTGKSSLINSLKRNKVCEVGAVPGVTKAMQSVHLEKHIKLLDCPGVVLSKSVSDLELVLRNMVRLESLPDPTPYVEAILSRCQKHQLMLQYNVPDFKDTAEFLTLLAQRMGKLKKGGIPDIARTARTMLQDWNSGKLTYYTAPPSDACETSHHVSAKIVTEWSKDFKIGELLVDEAKMMSRNDSTVSPLLIPSMGPIKAVVNELELEQDHGDETMAVEAEEYSDDSEDDQDEEMEDHEDATNRA